MSAARERRSDLRRRSLRDGQLRRRLRGLQRVSPRWVRVERHQQRPLRVQAEHGGELLHRPERDAGRGCVQGREPYLRLVGRALGPLPGPDRTGAGGVRQQHRRGLQRHGRRRGGRGRGRLDQVQRRLLRDHSRLLQADQGQSRRLRGDRQPGGRRLRPGDQRHRARGGLRHHGEVRHRDRHRRRQGDGPVPVHHRQSAPEPEEVGRDQRPAAVAERHGARGRGARRDAELADRGAAELRHRRRAADQGRDHRGHLVGPHARRQRRRLRRARTVAAPSAPPPRRRRPISPPTAATCRPRRAAAAPVLRAAAPTTR